MKNLEVLQLENQSAVEFPSNDPNNYHITSKEIFYISSHNTLLKYNCDNGITTILGTGDFHNVLAMKYLPIEEKICVVTPHTFYIVDPETNDHIVDLPLSDQCEAAAWSPGEELVAMVTATGAVQMWGVHYEEGTMFETGQSALEAQVPDTVYVGWGSKETQFRGSEGKLKKAEAEPEHEPIVDRQPTISWRGNGEMFAVNHWKQDRRHFIVFETPCNALYRSEHVPGLQPIIAWRPTGNMIATVAKQRTKQSVVIFEKNGQKRFEFELGCLMTGCDSTVRNVKWSPCANILTVLTGNTLHLLTCSNYQWYEKQRLVFTKDNPLLAFDWLQSTRLVCDLRVVTSRNVLTYTFRQHVHASSGTCAVINGAKLQLTNFDEAIIPPPLYSRAANITNAINFVAFHKDQVALVDARNHLFVYDTINVDSHLFEHDLNQTIDTRYPLACTHFQWMDSKRIRFVHDTKLYEIDILTGAIVTSDTVLPGPVRFLTDEPLQIDNAVHVVEETIEDRTVTLTLTNSGHFYVDDVQLSDVVNSFLLKDAYLIVTTKLNELYCVRLKQLPAMSKLPANNRRCIEQGAILVASLSNSPQVVLQMPRGNLETISCRLVAIDTLDCLLERNCWKEAMKFIRLEKLNANLMFDLNPERFLQNVESFTMAAFELNELTNFCLELESENVLRTLYKNWGEVPEYTEKIPKVCNELLSYFDRSGYVRFITTIMVINLRHFTLRSAFLYLQDLLRRSHNDATLKAPLIQALNTLKTYNCEQEQLYNESLMLYDLDLARFVASNCQMDPRIYEAQLEQLSNLPEVERRYHINLFAKQMKVAVAYLLRCPNADQVGAFIVNNNLYREAYESCPRTSEHFRSVSELFAQYLSRKGCHNDAAIVYRTCGDTENAVDEYKMALNWREVLNLTTNVKQTAVELAERLLKFDCFTDAAYLYEQYCGDYTKSIDILSQCKAFEQAFYTARRHNSDVEDIVKSLMDYKGDLMEKLTDLYALFQQYRQRLNEVRELKKSKRDNPSSHGNDRDDLFSDAGSTISTKSSRSSQRTTASSKHRRKEQRKKQDLRQGGIYEDIALVRALFLTIKEFWGRQEDVGRICTLLMQESALEMKEVRKLYDFYKTVDVEVKKSLAEIWPPCFYRVAGQPLMEGGNGDDAFLLDNLEHLDLEYRMAPTGWKNLSLGFFHDPLI